jgi:hypothetical protein
LTGEGDLALTLPLLVSWIIFLLFCEFTFVCPFPTEVHRDVYIYLRMQYVVSMQPHPMLM